MHEIDNEDRRGWGAVALDAFGEQTGQTGYAYDNAECLGEIAGDLICALLHLADAAGLDGEALIERGRDHWANEREDDEDDEVPDDGTLYNRWNDAPATPAAPAWDRSQGPKPYDHPAREGDGPGPGDFCKDCGDAITWQGPSPYDWLHVEEQDWRPLS